MGYLGGTAACGCPLVSGYLFASLLIVEPTMGVADLKSVFDRVVCINLDQQVDRWRRFVGQIGREWPFRAVERVPAVDGREQTPPAWWDTGPGAWGCTLSHLAVMRKALDDGIKGVRVKGVRLLFLALFWLAREAAVW